MVASVAEELEESFLLQEQRNTNAAAKRKMDDFIWFEFHPLNSSIMPKQNNYRQQNLKVDASTVVQVSDTTKPRIDFKSCEINLFFLIVKKICATNKLHIYLQPNSCVICLSV